MPILDAVALCKSYGQKTLLDQVDLTIRRGERIGIVGDNGAGKSTLGRILAGLLEPDLGQLHLRRGARVEYLSQDPILPTGRTALETVVEGDAVYVETRSEHARLCAEVAELSPRDSKLQGMLERQAELTHKMDELDAWTRAEDAQKVLTHLGIQNFEQQVDSMSGGERRRVALARLLLCRPDLAILDEPTNHLDADTIEWLEEFLSERFSGALLLITHDRFLLNRVVDRTLHVDAGKVYSTDGGWEEFLEARAEREEAQAKAEQNRQNFLRTELVWLRRQPKARTGKQKARIDRAEAALSVRPSRTQAATRFEFESTRLGGSILDCRDLEVRVGERVLVEQLELHLTKGERIGIVGPSGAGKTTLLATLLGQRPAHSGELSLGKNTSFAYLDQLRTALDEDLSVFDAVTEGHPTVTMGETTMSSYSWLERFRFRGEILRQKVAGLSGGERARLSLAKLLLTQANVIVLDEPTNDLDVLTLSALEDLLLEHKGSSLVVSHDRYFLDRVATSVLVVTGTGEVVHLKGGYSAYAEWRRERAAEAERKKQETKQETRVSSPAPSAAPRKLSYKENQELQGLLPKIEELEAGLAKLQAESAQLDYFKKPAPEREADRQREQQMRAQKEALEERWLILSELEAAAQK